VFETTSWRAEADQARDPATGKADASRRVSGKIMARILRKDPATTDRTFRDHRQTSMQIGSVQSLSATQGGIMQKPLSQISSPEQSVSWVQGGGIQMPIVQISSPEQSASSTQGGSMQKPNSQI
jgi:hypothetical protein